MSIYKFAWIAAFAGVVCVIVLIGGSLYLNSAGFRGQVVARVNQEIAGHIQVEDHSLSLPAGQLILTGVMLSDAEGRPIAGFDRLRLRLFWPALARRTVDISSLVIEQANLNLIVDAQGLMNLTEALYAAPKRERERPVTGTPWHLKIGEVQLRETQVAYQRVADGWFAQLSGLEASGSGDLARHTGRMTLRAQALHLRGPDLEETLRDWVLDLDYRHEAQEPLAVALQVGDSVLDLKGRVDQRQEEILLSLTTDLDISPEQLKPWLPPAIDLRGRLSGNIVVQGALSDPSISVRLKLGGVKVEDISVDEVAVTARMEQRRVDIDELDLRSPAGELNLSGALDLRPVFPYSFETQAADFNVATYAFDIRGRRLAPEKIPNLEFPWGGIWQGRLQVQGRGLSADLAQGSGMVDLQAQGVKAVAEGQAVEAAFSAQVEWTDQTVRIRQGQAKLGTHHLQVDGQYHWRDGRFKADALLQTPQLSSLGAILGTELPEGKVTLQLHGRGSVEKPEVRAVLAGQELSLSPWTLGRLLVEADLREDGTVHLARMVVQNGGSFLEGQGRVLLRRPDGTWRDDPGIDVNFNLDPVELSNFLGDSIGGDVRLHGRLHVGGSVRNPSADLGIAPSPVRWGEVGGLAEGRVRWADGRLAVSDLNLTNGRSVISLKGTIGWQDPQTGQWKSDPRVQASLTSDQFDLQDWVNEISGVLSVRAEVQGQLSDLKGTYRVTGGELDTGVQTFSSMRLQGRLDDDTIHVDQFIAALGPGQIVEGRGWFDFEQRFEARLGSEGIEIGRIDAFVFDPPASGLLNLELCAEGTLQQPLLKARVHVRNPRIGDQQWGDIHLRADMQDGQVALEADLNFRLTARYHMDSGDFEVSSNFEDTDIGPYLALLAGKQWSGRLSGSIQATGNRHAPEAIDARLGLTRAELSFEQVKLLQLDHLEAQLREGIVTLPPARFGFMQKGELVVQADGHIHRDMNIQARGDLPLAALAPFSDRIDEATGSIRIEASGQGPWTQLQWRAEAILARIGFILEDWDQAVHDVSGTVHISADRVVLENVTGMLDNGRFTLDGRLQMAEWRPAQGQLNFKAQALPVQVPGTMDMLLGADLVLKGDPRRSVLEGRITLLEGAYFKDVDLNILSSITERRRPVPPRRTWSPPQEVGAIGLNIEIDFRHPLLVDNNVASLQVAPDFKIGGTVANPVISGRAGVIEGELIFRRRAFSVTRGVVDFVDPYRIVPYFDFMAQAQIGRWEVTITALGPPDKLAVEMKSNPPESDSNILSLIVLGRIPGGSGQGAASATTEQMLATLIESGWGEQIKKRAGVDILELETGAAAEKDHPDRIRVTVGKQLSPRFTVKYSVEAAGGETIQRATSEYRFFEHVLASGFQDTAGVYGGELLFRFEFR